MRNCRLTVTWTIAIDGRRKERRPSTSVYSFNKIVVQAVETGLKVPSSGPKDPSDHLRADPCLSVRLGHDAHPRAHLRPIQTNSSRRAECSTKLQVSNIVIGSLYLNRTGLLLTSCCWSWLGVARGAGVLFTVPACAGVIEFNYWNKAVVNKRFGVMYSTLYLSTRVCLLWEVAAGLNCVEAVSPCQSNQSAKET